MKIDNLNVPAQISASAAAAVRLDFNPSSIDRVQKLKLLAAAFITECESIREEGIAGREASIAIAEIEAAAMWAVKAATKGG